VGCAYAGGFYVEAPMPAEQQAGVGAGGMMRVYLSTAGKRFHSSLI